MHQIENRRSMVHDRSVFLSLFFLFLPDPIPHHANGTRNMRLIDLVFLSSFSTRNVPFSSSVALSTLLALTLILLLLLLVEFGIVHYKDV